MKTQSQTPIRVWALKERMHMGLSLIGKGGASISFDGVIDQADINEEICGYIYGSRTYNEGSWIKTDAIKKVGIIRKENICYIITKSNKYYIISSVNYNPLAHNKTCSTYAAIVWKGHDLTQQPKAQTKKYLQLV